MLGGWAPDHGEFICYQKASLPVVRYHNIDQSSHKVISQFCETQ